MGEGGHATAGEPGLPQESAIGEIDDHETLVALGDDYFHTGNGTQDREGAGQAVVSPLPFFKNFSK